MNGDDKFSVDVKALQAIFGSTLLWVAAAFAVLMLFLFTTIRFDRITGEEVGILLNRITGNTKVIEQSGVTIYNGIISRLYVLDKTLQTLEMSGDKRPGTIGSLKVKTVDGSDVYVDVKVQYRMDANVAENVIRTSGPGDAYKKKWTEHYIRSICRNYLGELTTEEFYDAAKRNEKTEIGKVKTNERLKAFGIRIDQVVIPRRPRFYAAYEQMIKSKKLADQEVLEEQSKALAAKQRQQTLIVEETNKKNVAVEEFEGRMKQKVITAQAEGERVRKQADAYYDRITIGAEARLYQMDKKAKGILEKKTAEAKGIEELKKALQGEGGRNMVKLEYARKLKGITITGKPFTIDGTISRFEHLKGAASTGR